ncbi:MAG: hypothetical protein IJV46_06385, partial [Acidaminococcaceae bacterium]|nr:hypothetical protein [Acidaminococcaceae bacterium]
MNKRSAPAGREELFIKDGLAGSSTILYTALRNAGHARAFAERYENGTVPSVKLQFYLTKLFA